MKPTLKRWNLKLIHKLKGRGYYNHNQIINHVKDISFNDRKAILQRKYKPQHPDKLVFATHFTDDIYRIKRIFKKHWWLIKNNAFLKQLVFPSPPVVAYKANPSLKNKLVRAKLKPLESTKEHQTLNQNITAHDTYTNAQQTIPNLDPNYPFNLFDQTSQNFRNPIKRCSNSCQTCKQLETKSFAISTTRATKIPIKPPPEKRNFNCKSWNVVHLVTCKYKNCGAQ